MVSMRVFGKFLSLVVIMAVFAVCGVLPAAADEDALPVSLAGTWRFSLDAARQGLAKEYFRGELEDTITLPGTTDERQKGNKNTETTQTNKLTRLYPYWGAAWYQRDIDIPEAWKGKRVLLSLERTKRTTVWLDQQRIGEQDSLATPHEYDLTAAIAPGKHRLTILVDNGKNPPVNGGHQLSEDTQTNWNGILGRIELAAKDRVSIDDVQVYPDAANRKVRVCITLANHAGQNASGEMIIVLEEVEKRVNFENLVDGATVDAEIALSEDAKLWDEFSQKTCELNISMTAKAGGESFADSHVVTFGLRDFTYKGTQFYVNGAPTFLRGKHEACVFPLTGRAPMDVSGWARVFAIAKSYGINHYRFHSWCPPKAAFAAADQAGIYLQPELPNFGGDLGANRETEQYNRAEAKRILKAYGNHPSFVMFALGNELGGGQATRASIVQELRAYDSRHLYSQGSNYDLGDPKFAAGDDYWTTMRTCRGAEGAVRGSYAHCDGPLGHVQSGPPSTAADYSVAIGKVGAPVIGHEVGQYQVYPNFRETGKYTGVLRTCNFDVFRERLKAKGMLDQADDFLKASGALSVICYREEIEAALRTRGFGGFQLLDLQDFPGQGTALVGILDAFMDSKGLIQPKTWHGFCCETVPLVVFEKYAWTTEESFTAKLKVAHYGPAAIRGAILSWNLVAADGGKIAAGKLPPTDLARGELVECGTIAAPLSACKAPQKASLSVGIEGTSYQNSYDLWIYPAKVDTAPPEGVAVRRRLDAETCGLLAQGKRVILFPEPKLLTNAVDGFFASDFWCYPMFRSICQSVHAEVAPGTLGILCNPAHAALREFPTESHTNWQWWWIVMHSRSVILDDTPADFRPIVQVIDNFERNHKLGLVFEAKVGPGRILVCGSDLPGTQDRPEARQLMASLLKYAGSAKFDPPTGLSIEALKRILQADPANLAFKRPTTASASEVERGNTPEKATDGELSTRWCAADKNTGYWLQVDLQQAARLSGCSICWERAETYRYLIEGSADGSTWKILSDQRENKAKQRECRLAFQAENVRYVRVTITGLPENPPTWASICEFKVFDAEE